MPPWALLQGVRFVALLIGMLILARFPIRLFEDFAYIAYIGVVVLLVGVELIGFVVGGSQRWLDLGVVNLQHSKLMKIVIVLVTVGFYSQLPPGNTLTFPAPCAAWGMIGITADLGFVQPN